MLIDIIGVQIFLHCNQKFVSIESFRRAPPGFSFVYEWRLILASVSDQNGSRIGKVAL